MVQYHNLSVFSEGTGYMDFLKNMSSLGGIVFPMFLMAIVFIVPLMVMLKKDNVDKLNALIASSVYTTFLGIVLYISETVLNSLFIFIPALILVTTVAIAWYSKK